MSFPDAVALRDRSRKIAKGISTGPTADRKSLRRLHRSKSFRSVLPGVTPLCQVTQQLLHPGSSFVELRAG